MFRSHILCLFLRPTATIISTYMHSAYTREQNKKAQSEQELIRIVDSLNWLAIITANCVWIEKTEAISTHIRCVSIRIKYAMPIPNDLRVNAAKSVDT